MGCMDHRRVRRWLAGDGISCEGSNVRDREGEKSEKEEREREGGGRFGALFFKCFILLEVKISANFT